MAEVPGSGYEEPKRTVADDIPPPADEHHRSSFWTAFKRCWVPFWAEKTWHRRDRSIWNKICRIFFGLLILLFILLPLFQYRVWVISSTGESLAVSFWKTWSGSDTKGFSRTNPDAGAAAKEDAEAQALPDGMTWIAFALWLQVTGGSFILVLTFLLALFMGVESDPSLFRFHGKARLRTVWKRISLHTILQLFIFGFLGLALMGLALLSVMFPQLYMLKGGAYAIYQSSMAMALLTAVICRALWDYLDARPIRKAKKNVTEKSPV